MSEFYVDNHSTSEQPSTKKGLLASGWQPLYRQIDQEYLWKLAIQDPGELMRKWLDVCGTVANSFGRTDHTWWANLLDGLSGYPRQQVDEFWDYITPAPPEPNWQQKTLSTVTPVHYQVSREVIPIHYVLNRFQEITILRILQLLGRPTMITQEYRGRYFYFPIDRFQQWHQLDGEGTILVYWADSQLWLQLFRQGQHQRYCTLIGSDLESWIQKVTYNLAVMLSGYQSRIGQVQSQFSLRSFPADIQQLTDTVQEIIFTHHQAAFLVYGKPGTGKTAWTQAIAKEVLVPLGYVIFILDHDAVEHFVPPTYLNRICIIINEADNLAQDRSQEAAQTNTKTEHILSLLDGTLHQSVIDEAKLQVPPQLVVLMTCNTIERMDPAVLRQGRINLTYEFTHQFVG